MMCVGECGPDESWDGTMWMVVMMLVTVPLYIIAIIAWIVQFYRNKKSA